MALVSCPECGKDISDRAVSCPTCGFSASPKAEPVRFDPTAFLSNSISILTLVLAVVGAVIAYKEFVRQDDWERHKFVSEEIKAFYADTSNQDVLSMLDYDPASISAEGDIQTGKASETKPSRLTVHFAELVNAIGQEEQMEGTRLLIRQKFERFLRVLSRYHYLIDHDVMRPEDLCPDLSYPLALLSGDPETRREKMANSKVDTEPLAVAFQAYVTRWQYDEITSLDNELGKVCNYKTRFN